MKRYLEPNVSIFFCVCLFFGLQISKYNFWQVIPECSTLLRAPATNGVNAHTQQCYSYCSEVILRLNRRCFQSNKDALFRK